MKVTFSRITYIYALVDPAGVVRYIGKSDSPWKRYARHLKDVADTHKGRWIKSLLCAGHRPELRILEVVAFQEWQHAERKWIASFGIASLTNSTEGGIGPLEPCPETREKMRLRKLGGHLTVEHRRKVSAALKGKAKPKRTRSHIEKIASSKRGITPSAEHRAKLSIAGKRSEARNALGLKGVYFDRERGKYQAFIRVDKKIIHLGRHLTANAAALAYNNAARANGWPEEGLNRL